MTKCIGPMVIWSIDWSLIGPQDSRTSGLLPGAVLIYSYHLVSSSTLVYSFLFHGRSRYLLCHVPNWVTHTSLDHIDSSRNLWIFTLVCANSFPLHGRYLWCPVHHWYTRVDWLILAWTILEAAGCFHFGMCAQLSFCMIGHVHCTVTPALNILGISLVIFSLWYAHSFPFVWWPFVRKVLLVFCTLVSAILRISLDIFTLVCAWWPFVRSVVTSGRWLCHCRCHESELTDSPLLTILTGYLWKWSLWIWSLRYARTAFFCVVGHFLVMY